MKQTKQTNEAGIKDPVGTVYDLHSYKGEEVLSNKEFMQKLQDDDLMIIKETSAWAEKYNIAEEDFGPQVEGILDGDINLADEGLSETQMEEVKRKMATVKKLTTEELLEYICSNSIN